MEALVYRIMVIPPTSAAFRPHPETRNCRPHETVLLNEGVLS